jgi:hypothetical protein
MIHHTQTKPARRGAPSRLLALSVLLCLLGWAPGALAALITIKLDKTTLSEDEDLTMEVRASGTIDEVVPPNTPGFRVGGSSRSSEFSMGPGGTVQSHVLRQTLIPTQAGRHTIGPALARRGGQVVARSETVTVTVTSAPRATITPEQARDLQARAGERFFLLPQVPDRPVYVGEPFVLSYHLYVRTDSSAMSAQWRTPPALDAFSVEDLRGHAAPRPRREFVGRFQYDVSLQAQYLIVPLAAGKADVGPAVMEVLSGDLFRQRRYTLRAPALSLDVRAVPREGRPAEFEPGNLGRYEMETELRPTTVQVGERTVLTVRVTGHGAVESVKAPPLRPIRDVTVDPLPTSDADRVERGPAGVSGTRVFQWVLVPEAPGEIELPPLRFAFFDPAEGRYRVVAGAPMALTVEGQRAAPSQATAGMDLADVPTEDTFAAGLRDIRAESDLRSRRPVPPHRRLWFWLPLALLAGLLGVVEAVALARRHKARTAAARRMRRARGVAGKALKTAQRSVSANDSRAFFTAVRTTLAQFLGDRLGVSVRGLTHEQLRRALVARGAAAELALEVVEELENADYARFAPVSVRGEEMQRALARARDLITALDKLPQVEDSDE